MNKKNLLLCFDAFGTIFTPRGSVAVQYGEVARSFGVKISDEQVGSAFKKGRFRVVCRVQSHPWSCACFFLCLENKV